MEPRSDACRSTMHALSGRRAVAKTTRLRLQAKLARSAATDYGHPEAATSARSPANDSGRRGESVSWEQRDATAQRSAELHWM